MSDLIYAAATTAAATDSTAFLLLEIVGTIAFAISGVMAAARARMDWLGAAVLALVVAIGGGTLRDVLLGEFPVTWLVDTWPVFLAIGTAIVMLVLLRVWPRANLETTTPLLIADAAGLSAFVILGTQIGVEEGLTPFIAIMLGVLTGVGGGIIRDLLTGQKPVVLTGQIYAVAGIAGAALLVALDALGARTEIAVWSSVAAVLVIRLLAVRRSWHLPRAMPDTSQDRTTNND